MSKASSSSLSCISLPSLPTIVEERSAPIRSRRTPKRAPKHLCAIFDFETFVLDSELLTDEEINERQRKSSDVAITNMAIQEYINKRIHTTVTLITIPPRIIKKLKTSRLPCLGKKKSIYLTKYKNKDDGEYYMRLSTVKPSDKHNNNNNNNNDNNRKDDNMIKCALNGMVFAIIFSTFPSTKRFIINGVYYHGHGSPVYTPNFDGPEKDLRACKPYDVFIADKQNSIKTIKPFKRKRAKSCNGTNNGNNPIAFIKSESTLKRSTSFKKKPKTRKIKSCPWDRRQQNIKVNHCNNNNNNKRQRSRSPSQRSRSPSQLTSTKFRSRSPIRSPTKKAMGLTKKSCKAPLRSKSPKLKCGAKRSSSNPSLKSIKKSRKMNKNQRMDKRQRTDKQERTDKQQSRDKQQRVEEPRNEMVHSYSLSFSKHTQQKRIKNKKKSIKKSRVCGENSINRDSNNPSLKPFNSASSIDSALCSSLSPIKESKVLSINNNNNNLSLKSRKRNEQRS